ncbi:MAG TPA: NAD(P)H-binding protein [Vicinamibacterales bacterium]
MSPKKLLVLGATGGTGRQIVSQALEAGHHVTAFVRNPDKMAIRHDRLRFAHGDVPGGGPALGDAVREQDVVISALGRGQSFKADSLMQRSIPSIVNAMRANHVRRLIFMSAYGLGDTSGDAPLLSRMFAGVFLRGIYADKLAGEALLKRSDLEWTIVHPTALTNGPLTRQYRSAEHMELRGFPTISRADTAHFILNLIESPASIRKVLLVSY